MYFSKIYNNHLKENYKNFVYFTLKKKKKLLFLYGYYIIKIKFTSNIHRFKKNYKF